MSIWKRTRQARLFFPHRKGKGKLPKELVELCSAHLHDPQEAHRRVLAAARLDFLKEDVTVSAKTPEGIARFLGDSLLTKAMVVWWDNNTFSILSNEGWVQLEAP